MELKSFFEKLRNAGWKEERVDSFVQNKLNHNVLVYFTFRDRLSFRYHETEKMIRLLVYGKATEGSFKINYVDRLDPSFSHVGHSDVRGFQIDVHHNIEAVVDLILSMQEDISLESYFDFYLGIQSTSEVSVLMLEQYI